MQLWLQRHAQPLIAPGMCYGRLDVAACPEATHRAASALAAAIPHHTTVITSPLQRCELLAGVLHAQRPDLIPEIDPQLAEMDFGEWENRSWADIGQQPLQRWTDDFAHHAPGGGESVSQVMQRVAAALATSGARAAATQLPVLWITHAGVVRAAMLLAQGITQVSRADQWPRHAPAWGEKVVLEFGSRYSAAPGSR